MSDDPPKGREREVAERLGEIIRRADATLHEGRVLPSLFSTWIAADHALVGVRVNGWEALVNVMDVVARLRCYAKNAQEFSEYAARLDREAAEALKLAEEAVKGFRYCPTCCGSSGAYDPPEARYVRESWQPCDHCRARGIVKA